MPWRGQRSTGFIDVWRAVVNAEVVSAARVLLRYIMRLSRYNRGTHEKSCRVYIYERYVGVKAWGDGNGIGKLAVSCQVIMAK